MNATLVPIFCLILASMIFPTGDAAPSQIAGLFHGSKAHPSTLPNLNENEKKFYEMIVAPLAAKCADIKFSPGLGTFQTVEKAMLCENANKIAKLYTELNGIYHNNKKKNLVGTTQQAIRAVVLLEDLQDLKKIYSDLLSWEVAKPIEQTIDHIANGHNARDNLHKAFIETFSAIEQWKNDVTKMLNEKRANRDKEVANKINKKRNKIADNAAKKVDVEGKDEADQQQQDPVEAENEKESGKLEADLIHAKDWDTVERRRIAFKFLCISYEMGKLFNQTPQEEQHWTMEQFAANLFVYSMRVDRPAYMGEPEIEGIAEKWPITGMENYLPHHGKAPME
jgi:hypothetical protein